MMKIGRDRPRTDPPTLTMRSKETEVLLTLIRSVFLSIITFLLTLHWLGNRINILKYFQCDHRFNSFFQLDLQEAGKLTLKFSSLCCRKYF